MADAHQGHFTKTNPDGTAFTCFRLPPLVNSPGFSLKDPRRYLLHGLPLLLLQMLVILSLSLAIHFLALRRLKIPYFVSQMLCGIIIGPTVLGSHTFVSGVLFPRWSQDTIDNVGLLGYASLLFLTGVKMDAAILLRTNKTVLALGIAPVLVPFVISMSSLTLAMPKVSKKGMMEGATLASIQSLTSFPVIFYVIKDLKIMNSELGRLGLSSAVVGNLFGLLISIILPILPLTFTKPAAKFLKMLAAVLGFILFLVFIVRPVYVWAIRKSKPGKTVSLFYVFMIIALAFLSEAYFRLLYQIQHLGPFMVGLAIPPGPPLGAALVDRFESVIWSVLMPVYVITSVMRGDLKLVVRHFNQIKGYIMLILFNFVCKLAACLVPSLSARIPVKDSMALGLILSTSGFIEIGSYAAFEDNRVITPTVFSAVASFILINAAIVPLIARYLYDPSRKFAGYQTRNILSLKSKEELRVLACIHRPDNVHTVIKLTEALRPTRENPINLYVLHLIELIGRANPVFIYHPKNEAVSESCSETVVDAFNQYEKNNRGSVSVHNFTAISTPKLMYEDICTLALDSLSSLILVPFHKKWYRDGEMESESKNLRYLTCKILEREAPCSVGIYCDRGKLGQRISNASATSPLSVCVIFIGGNDDCEALALANQMARNPMVSRTVVHLITEQSSSTKSVQSAIQSRVGDIAYVEELVRDGPETALKLRNMADEHDLYIVGRRYGIECQQTQGLTHWSEFPELGVIGDLLVSRDLDTRASVLVVEQQKVKK